jgi:predicted CDP-diglyceride synthetase/phosphatidate cytidylyltransferase
MTRLINSFIILFVFALTVAAAQPKMEFVGGDTYNWGKVSPKDSPLKTVMKMKNTGDEVLVITEVALLLNSTKKNSNPAKQRNSI